MADRPRVPWGKGLVVAAASGMVVAFYLSGAADRLSWAGVKANADALRAAAAADPLPAVLLYLTAYAVLTGLSLPVGVWLTLLGGALFGRSAGTAAAVAGATAGATLAMLGSRYVLRDWVRARLGRRLAAVDRGLERGGAAYLLTLRLLPAVPFWLVNLAAGLTAMRPAAFAAASLVGMVPGAFVFANAGAELAAVESPADVLTPRVLAAFALLAALPLAARWVAGRLRPS